LEVETVEAATMVVVVVVVVVVVAMDHQAAKFILEICPVVSVNEKFKTLLASMVPLEKSN